MTDEVITALGHFKEISVLGLQTSRSLPADPDLARLNADLGLQYVLEGSVRAGDDAVRVTARVTSSTTGAVLWSRTYDYPTAPNDLFTLPTVTAGEVAAAVAQPYGIVFQAETARERQSPPDNLDAYICTLKYYVYRAAISPEKYGEVRLCLEQAVGPLPDYATAWALLAFMYIDEIRTGFATGDTSPCRARARRGAHRHRPRSGQYPRPPGARHGVVLHSRGRGGLPRRRPCRRPQPERYRASRPDRPVEGTGRSFR
jgi:adenylate cyclase